MTRRPSTIDRLSPEIRETIGSLLKQNRTLDEILAKLRELDVDVSRSALGRHAKSFADVSERMRRSKDIALALAERFGDQPDDKLARMNLELMHGLVFETLMAAAGSEDEEGEALTLPPQQVKFLADALKSLNTAAKADADRILKIRADLAKENAKKIAEAVTSGDIDAEAAERARQILGFA